ncbi:hypothetical protein KSS87_011985 [Heliosperma pusillum]|nr:hypothetical protein KSS87_011985 [Heliosperma pusillum]
MRGRRRKEKKRWWCAHHVVSTAGGGDVCLVRKEDGFNYLFKLVVLMLNSNEFVMINCLPINLDLCKNPVDGFSAGLVNENNIFEWSVTIIGPPDTLYEGVFFNALMTFPANYPNSPPTVRFTSDIWHRNVYQDVRVCISILHPPGDDPNGYEPASERWSPVHTNRKDRKIEPLAQLDELAKASEAMQDMRDCYDSLLSASAAAAATNSAYEFSESLREMGVCLLQKIALNDDEQSGKAMLMLGKAQFQLQKQVDGYLQAAKDEFDEEATLFVFRLKSLKQGQSRTLLTQAARHHAAQPVTLELGRKSPLVVFDDVDLDQAAEWTAFGCLWTNGQICSATSRLILHENIAAEFLDRLVKWVKNIKISDPFEEGCRMGPVISQGQYEKVLKFVSTAKSEGATVLCGGARPEHLKKGYFVEPTIITVVTTSMQIWREEVFGPVLCVKTFSSEDEAIELANDTQYGLGAAVISKDLDRCERVTKHQRLNSPDTCLEFEFYCCLFNGLHVVKLDFQKNEDDLCNLSVTPLDEGIPSPPGPPYNTAIVSVTVNCGPVTYGYVGGKSSNTQSSCEKNAQKAVLDIVDKFEIWVEDISMSKRREINRCAGLYHLKRSEIANEIKGTFGDPLPEIMPIAPPLGQIPLIVDYTSILKRVHNKVHYQTSEQETINHGNSAFTSWVIITYPTGSLNTQTIFSICSNDIRGARNNLAKRVIEYLIPIYNLQIVDVNYSPTGFAKASFSRDMEKESCISMRARVLGINDVSATSPYLIPMRHPTRQGI